MVSVKLWLKAREFIDTLNDILVSALGINPHFVVDSLKDNSVLRIKAKQYDDDGILGFPLIRSCDTPDKPVLFLSVVYQLTIDARDRHLQVEASSVGLYVDVTGGHKKPRPLVRVEYKRQRAASAAHMHIHANSPELAWIYGTATNPAPNLHDLHFPVGGRRFRPTLEEFIFFLNDEKLFTDWQEGWRQNLERTLTDWERIQAKSAVRTYPQEAAEALISLGHEIHFPED